MVLAMESITCFAKTHKSGSTLASPDSHTSCGANMTIQTLSRKRITRPFAFEDLPLNDKGKRVEPESWGPIYSKPKPPPKRVNDETRIPTNCASGQKGQFDAAKHRAKLAAEFAADAAADRLAWATGKLSVDRHGMHGDIHHAYAQAMDTKAARLAREAVRKPHYVLRDGSWRLAA